MALVPDPARPETMPRFKSAVARGDGRFTFTGVAPGQYRLYAFEQAPPNVPGNPDLFKPFESEAVKLSVREADRKQVDVRVLKLAGGGT